MFPIVDVVLLWFLPASLFHSRRTFFIKFHAQKMSKLFPRSSNALITSLRTLRDSYDLRKALPFNVFACFCFKSNTLNTLPHRTKKKTWKPCDSNVCTRVFQSSNASQKWELRILCFVLRDILTVPSLQGSPACVPQTRRKKSLLHCDWRNKKAPVFSMAASSAKKLRDWGLPRRWLWLPSILGVHDIAQEAAELVEI